MKENKGDSRWNLGRLVTWAFKAQSPEETEQPQDSKPFALLPYDKTTLADYIANHPRKDEIDSVVAAEYARQFNDGKLHEIRSLRVLTGIDFTPDPNAVQQRYNEYVISDKYDSFREIGFLSELTGIKPEFSEDFVQQQFNKWFEEKEYHKISELQKIANAKFTPDEEKVQQHYTVHLGDEGNLHDFESLFKLTGVKPDEGLVLGRYRLMVDHIKKQLDEDKRFKLPYNPLYAYEFLKEKTRVEMPEALVQELYGALARHLDIKGMVYLQEKTAVKTEELPASVVKQMHEARHPETKGERSEYSEETIEIKTRIKPDFPLRTIWEIAAKEWGYLTFRFAKWNSDKLRQLYECKVSLPKDIELQVYEQILDDPNFENILRWASGYDIPTARIPEKLVQRKYHEFARQGHLFDIRGLMRYTEYEPKFDDVTIQCLFRQYIHDGCGKASWLDNKFRNVTTLAELTGVQPDFGDEFLQRTYWNLFTEDKISLIGELEEITGVPMVYPLEKVHAMQAAAVKGGDIHKAIGLAHRTGIALTDNLYEHHVQQMLTNQKTHDQSQAKCQTNHL